MTRNARHLTLESTAPFQGLPELVASAEGLFEQEGLTVSWADRGSGPNNVTRTDVDSPHGQDPFASHGNLLEQGRADMYNACEAGNYCRVESSSVASRQVGRRAIIAYAAIVVRADSPVYTPQQLANRVIGLPFFFGTHYLALQLLEGFLPRDAIKVCKAPNGSMERFDALLAGEVEATTLTEPYVTLAEMQGCRIVCAGFYHGSEVASDRVDAETYAAFNRAVRKAVARIQADKTSYLHYFIDYHAARDPRIAALKPTDLRASRIVVTDPVAIPTDELQRTSDWLQSWGMLSRTEWPLELVDVGIQAMAHAAE